VHPSPATGTHGLDSKLFEVNTQLRSWGTDQVVRAGVSSFGLGGTNAHVVLESAPLAQQGAAHHDSGQTIDELVSLPLVLSAKSKAALRSQARRWSSWLRGRTDVTLLDVVSTAARRRAHHSHRAVINAASIAEACEALSALARGESHGSLLEGRAAERGRVVFAFPGQGSQWVGMGSQLLAQSRVFREAIEACDAAFLPLTGWSVREQLEGTPDLDQVEVVQPLLYSVAIGLAAVWRALGVEPDAVVGGSQGEVPAAVVAGALSLADGARVVVARSRAVKACSRLGGMAIVDASVGHVQDWLEQSYPTLSIGGINGPTSTVVSGGIADLDRFLSDMAQQGRFCRRVNIDYASHSAYMDPLLPELESALTALAPRPGTVSFYSTVTGRLGDGAELGASYWCRNLREPVRLDLALAAMRADGCDVFVEVSAHPLMSMLLGPVDARNLVVSSISRRGAGLSAVLQQLGSLHAHGFEVCWDKVLSSAGRLVDLPGYAFQRQRYWASPATARTASAPRPRDGLEQLLESCDPFSLATQLQLPQASRGAALAIAPYLEAWRHRKIEQREAWRWLYEETWHRSNPPHQLRLDGTWAVLSSPAPQAWSSLVEASLAAGGATVRRLDWSDGQGGLREHIEQLPADTRGIVLFADSSSSSQAPIGVSQAIVDALSSLQALHAAERTIKLWVVMRTGMLGSGAEGAVADGGLSGFSRMAANEAPLLWGGVIDLGFGPIDGVAPCLISCLAANETEAEVALRVDGRFVRRLKRLPISEGSAEGAPILRATALLLGSSPLLGFLARWCLDNGATRLVLANDLSPSQLAEVTRQLENRVASIQHVACDTQNPQQVAAVMRDIGDLSAVVNLVPHIDHRDAAMIELGSDEISRQVDALVTSTLLISEVISQRALDCFLVVDRIADHVAGAIAGTMLDAAMVSLRARGVPASLVRCGPHAWESEAVTGLRPTSWQRLGESLRQGLRAGPGTFAVADVDWGTVMDSKHGRADQGWMDGVPEACVAREGRQQGDADGSSLSLRAQLAQVPPGEHLALTCEGVRREVARVLQLPLSELALDTPLQQLGMDSLMVLQIRSRLSEFAGVELANEDIFRLESCSALGQALLAGVSKGGGEDAAPEAVAPGSWLRVLKPARDPHTTLLCFAGMGGATSGFIPLARYLEDGIELVAVQLPGREARRSEEPEVHMQSLVAQICAEVSSRLDRRVLILGHSQGSWAALELCHALRRKMVERLGVDAPMLGLVAACAIPAHVPTTAELASFADITEVWDRATLDELAQRFRGVLPDELIDNQELLQEYLRNCRADLALARNYEAEVRATAQRPLDIPVLAVAALSDPLIPDPAATDRWAEVTDAEFHRVNIPGSHAAPIENPQHMARVLSEWLTELIAFREAAAEEE
jgi:acyl transferase domain-containing protein/surfactin synthase thioesterase subunit/acyl carrier protein